VHAFLDLSADKVQWFVPNPCLFLLLAFITVLFITGVPVLMIESTDDVYSYLKKSSHAFLCLSGDASERRSARATQ
jgi:hypothetical protein